MDAAGEETKIDSGTVRPLPRQQSKMIKPDIEIDILGEKQGKDGEIINTLILNEDVYNVIIILKAHGIWDQLSVQDRRALSIGAIFCALIQFGTLSLLLADMIAYPPWAAGSDAKDAFRGTTSLAIAIKALCLVMLTVFFLKELYSVATLNLVGQRVFEFGRYGAGGVYNLIVLLMYFNMLLYLIALCLSVGIVSTAETSFDAVLNAVAITFILEVDDWMFHFVKDKPYVRPELFQIQYKVGKLATRTYALKMYLGSKCCLRHFYRKPTDRHERGAPISARFRCWFLCFFLAIGLAFIFIGFQLEQFETIAYVGLAMMAFISCSCCLFCCIYCFWHSRYRATANENWQRYVSDMQELANEYKAKVATDGDEQDNKQIEDEFVDKCFDMLYEYEAGVGVDAHHEERLRKLLYDDSYRF